MLMHAIGTSLAFWIYTIVRETQDAIRMKRLGKDTTSENRVFIQDEQFLLNFLYESRDIRFASVSSNGAA